MGEDRICFLVPQVKAELKIYVIKKPRKNAEV